MADRIWLSDDNGLPRETFSIGESVFVSGRGLKLSALYEFVWLHEGRRREYEVLAHYTTDRYGTLQAALLMPYFGLLNERQRQAGIDACYQAFEGSTFNLRARLIQGGKYRTVQTLKLELASDRQPRIFAVDEHGRLQTGIEQGEGQIAVLLRHFSAGCVRIFMVRRQFGWRAGDRLDP